MSVSQLERVERWEAEKEQKAARDFSQAQQYVQQQKQKLASLTQYRLDYLQQIKQSGSQGVGARHYSQHLSFIGKLDKACEQQNQMIAQASLAVEARKRAYLAQQKRRKAISHLIEQKRLAAEAKEAREEQLMMDELAMQRFYRQRVTLR